MISILEPLFPAERVAVSSASYLRANQIFGTAEENMLVISSETAPQSQVSALSAQGYG